MKCVFNRTCGIVLTAMLALAGCFSESTQAEAVNQTQTTKPSSPAPAPAPVQAQAPAMDFREGVHYTTIVPAIPTQVPQGKVEVVEMFWYGCPHCYSLEPTIQRYLQTKPENVVFQQVPASGQSDGGTPAIFSRTRAVGLRTGGSAHSDAALAGQIVFENAQ